jgi:hypothetical protein
MRHNEYMKNTANNALLVLLISLTLNTTQAAVYKTVDKNGNVTYSDSPGDRAEKLNLPPIPVINISPSPDLNLTPKPYAKEQSRSYNLLSIDSPKNGATIRNNSGNVSVSISISPTLAENDTIVLKSNGAEIGRGRSSILSISQMDRGSHTLQAVIVNADGKILSISETITFHLLRQSRLINQAK